MATLGVKTIQRGSTHPRPAWLHPHPGSQPHTPDLATGSRSNICEAHRRGL